jgi:2-oxo-4-hydroxy-4-carboxy-5-ureidoimidazoline decarboxylase
MADTRLVDVAELDRAAPGDAAGLLRPSCASARWVGRLVLGRPHGSLGRLVTASDEAIAALQWPDIEEALAAHPRIGGRGLASGQEAPPNDQEAPPNDQEGPGGVQEARPSERESSWSRQEQAGAAGAGAGVRAALLAGNVEYEERFGHVFLICAAGRPAGEMLGALRARLGHDPESEHEVVRGELLRIVRLRLAKTFQ